MRYSIYFLMCFCILSCETNKFDSDKRQIVAKDLIRSKYPRTRSFDITAFREDTLQSWSDTLFKKPIQYTLEFTYLDSAGISHNQIGEVIFTPDGKSVLDYNIKER